MPILPADHGQVFEGLVIPVHLTYPDGAPFLVQAHQGQPHPGIFRQSLGVAPGLRSFPGVCRVADIPDRLIRIIGVLHQEGIGIGRPPESLIPVHFLAGHELRQPQGHLIAGIGTQGQYGELLVKASLLTNQDHHHGGAGGIGHLGPVRRDGRVENGLISVMPGPIGLHPPQGPGRGTQTVLGDPNQPELPAQGENHPVTGPVNAVGDDSLPAFTRALTSGPFLRRHILHVGICKEVTGVGQENLVVTTILVEGGEP